MIRLHELLFSSPLRRVGSEIIKVALPSIRLWTSVANETQLIQGTTKFGGSPEVPLEKAWPTYNDVPLPFLAQINLADTMPYDTDHLLPETGILSFFFSIDAFFERQQSNNTGATAWHVWYTQNPSQVQRVPVPEVISAKRRYRASTITFSTEITLPDYSQFDSTSIVRLGQAEPFTDDEERAYHDIQAQLISASESAHHIPLHRMLGYPDVVQWDMYDDLKGSGTDWQLLFQMDSDSIPETNWGDTGRIYFWIRSQDLRNRDFSKVQLILQST